MAQYDCPAPDDLFECPYHATHMVRASRMPYHLMKCRKNYAGNDFATCPFNARHELPRPELRHHIARCPDKVMLEQDIIYDNKRDKYDPGNGGNTDLPESSWEAPPSSENWDLDDNNRDQIQKVDPRVFTGEQNEHNVMSDKKKRELFEKLKQKGILKGDSKKRKNGKTPAPEPTQTYGDEPMRMPRNQPQVLLAAQRQGPQLPTQPITLLAMQGVGRGRPVPPPDAKNEDYTRLIQAMARGRGSSQRAEETAEPRVGHNGYASSSQTKDRQ